MAYIFRYVEHVHPFSMLWDEPKGETRIFAEHLFSATECLCTESEVVDLHLSYRPSASAFPLSAPCSHTTMEENSIFKGGWKKRDQTFKVFSALKMLRACSELKRCGRIISLLFKPHFKISAFMYRLALINVYLSFFIALISNQGW